MADLLERDWASVVDEARQKTPIGPCSFCGKTTREVKAMIAGPPSLFICDECVGLCVALLDGMGQEAPR